MFARASDATPEVVLQYPCAMEIAAQAPPSQRSVLAAAIPKSPTRIAQRRPILIYGTCQRVWGRLRRQMVRQWWASAIARHPVLGLLSAAPGRSPSERVWRIQVHAAGCDARGGATVTILSDITRCFDTVPWSAVIAGAVSMQFPLQLLRLALVSYGWPRTLGADGLLAAPLHPTRGIGAGSAAAVFEFGIAMGPTLTRAAMLHPLCVYGAHVDDLSVTTCGASEHEAVSCAVRGWVELAHGLGEDLGFPLDRSKQAALGSTARV